MASLFTAYEILSGVLTGLDLINNVLGIVNTATSSSNDPTKDKGSFKTIEFNKFQPVNGDDEVITMVGGQGVDLQDNVLRGVSILDVDQIRTHLDAKITVDSNMEIPSNTFEVGDWNFSGKQLTHNNSQGELVPKFEIKNRINMNYNAIENTTGVQTQELTSDPESAGGIALTADIDAGTTGNQYNIVGMKRTSTDELKSATGDSIDLKNDNIDNAGTIQADQGAKFNEIKIGTYDIVGPHSILSDETDNKIIMDRILSQYVPQLQKIPQQRIQVVNNFSSNGSNSETYSNGATFSLRDIDANAAPNSKHKHIFKCYFNFKGSGWGSKSVSFRIAADYSGGGTPISDALDYQWDGNNVGGSVRQFGAIPIVMTRDLFLEKDDSTTNNSKSVTLKLRVDESNMSDAYDVESVHFEVIDYPD